MYIVQYYYQIPFRSALQTPTPPCKPTNMNVVRYTTIPYPSEAGDRRALCANTR